MAPVQATEFPMDEEPDVLVNDVDKAPMAKVEGDVDEVPTEKADGEVDEAPTDKVDEEVDETPTEKPDGEVDEAPTEKVDEAPTEKVDEAPTPREEGDEKRVEAPSIAFECDFDDQPTVLYQSLQKRDWESGLQRSKEVPIEAKTWVSRFEKDGKLRWRLLPIHAAIIFGAPESVVEALLCAYPTSAECKDDQGMLPLHLAFRTGSSEAVAKLLLAAYPQSVDVKDRKGRIPLVLAQASKSPNRDAFLNALERGPSYYAALAAASERASVTAEQRAIFDASLLENENRHAFELQTLEKTATEEREQLQKKIAKLQSDLDKAQETSQVLVDHVNSLEAQLLSRGDTERFLATRIATADQALKTVTREKEELEAELRDANASLSSEKMALEEKIHQLNDANSDSKLASVLAKLDLMEKEKVKYTARTEDKLKTLEIEWASSKASCAVLQAQLKKKVENEQKFASQLSTLASSLAESSADAGKASEAHAERVKEFEQERDDLKMHIKTLTRKLAIVANALDEITEQQALIVEQAATHEETMAQAARTQNELVVGAQRQNEMYEKFEKEHEEAAAMLERQRQEVVETLEGREKIMSTVLMQNGVIDTAHKERQILLDSVSQQRTTIDSLRQEHLSELPQLPYAEEGKDALDVQEMANRHAKEDEMNDEDKEEGEGAGHSEALELDMPEEDMDQPDASEELGVVE